MLAESSSSITQSSYACACSSPAASVGMDGGSCSTNRHSTPRQCGPRCHTRATPHKCVSDLGLTMKMLRPAMAEFIAERAEHFKSFLTDKQRTPRRWHKLIEDIWYTAGAARRWSEELEIAVLASMFQCPIQCITSRQGDYDDLVTAAPDTQLGTWWSHMPLVLS